MKLAILVTGGTFDKEYNEITGTLYFKKTHVPEMLALGRCRLACRIQVVMLKDSLDITTTDRSRIARACLEAKESRIVITHGTDTMEQTAHFLASRVAGKTVVLTGAMVPYQFNSSDGMFNLGTALAMAQKLPHGVYVAMNGKCFRGNQVTKNRKRGCFEKKKTAA